MEEYRALRERYGMLELIRTPELAAEVTLQPINAFSLDAAIIFADILPPLISMGLDLEFVSGVGPRIHNPIRSPYDVDLLAVPPASEELSFTLDAIRIASTELSSRGIPLIGFAGAPFTLAAYAIEGGGSKDFAQVKAFMFSEPSAWDRLMTKLTTLQADYLLAQSEAGAAALQVFDSWVGIAIGMEDYRRYVQPYNRQLFSRLKQAGVPVINFSTGTFPYLEEVAACGGEVIGVDYRMPLGAAWNKIGPEFAIQGNLDPISLLAPWSELRNRIDSVLDEADGRPGHIFNLGHGLVPSTPVDNVRRMIDYIHERTGN